jgi:hypothetical protein
LREKRKEKRRGKTTQRRKGRKERGGGEERFLRCATRRARKREERNRVAAVGMTVIFVDAQDLVIVRVVKRKMRVKHRPRQENPRPTLAIDLKGEGGAPKKREKHGSKDPPLQENPRVHMQNRHVGHARV